MKYCCYLQKEVRNVEINYDDLKFRGKLRCGFHNFGNITIPGKIDYFCCNPNILKEIDFIACKELDRIPIPITIGDKTIWCEDCPKFLDINNLQGG